MIIDKNDIYIAQPGDLCQLPLYISGVKAGFPSPADDYIERTLDLNDYLLQHREATFFVRARGNSMERAGIFDGDLLIVDRALEARGGSVVIAALNGEFTVKRISREGGHILLMPENDDYEPIVVTAEMDFSIWGVVTYVVHSLR